MQKGFVTSGWWGVLASTTCVSFLLFGHSARAFEYQFNNGVDIQFDNTLQYSLLVRAAPESSVFANNPNQNDGDNNLKSGIISNRADLITKFDISYDNYGFDTSIYTFYDTVYNQHTQQAAGSLTYNPTTTPSNKFTSATITQSGRDVQLRNLFIYGSNTIDGVPVTLRVGRLVNLFGESLFFAGNGIAYGMAPLDITRALSVPNSQAKDLFLPTGQALLTVQPTDSITVSAYYQFEWEKYNFPAEGSYFGISDILDEGGQRFIAVAPTATTPGIYYYRGADEKGKDTGQFGIALHYDPPNTNYDFGLYALQYNDTEPQLYFRNAANPAYIAATNSLSLGSYQLVYPNHIQIYGVSSSTSFGPVNVAGEVSARTNEPLESLVFLGPGENANNANAPLYAEGNTLHYQASAIYAGPATSLWEGSSWAGEFGGDNLLGFTKNRENFNRTYRHMALGLRTTFTANYFQVLPGLDVNIPVGLGWNFMGDAPDTPGFNGTGIDRGGDLTIGVSGTYLNKWTGGISYTRYIARPGRDPYADRDFVAFNVERTF